MPIRQRGDAGFTLLEVLVVVAILGFLMAGIVVVAGSARERSQTAKSLAQVQKLATAVTDYYGEYRICPPDGYDEVPYGDEGMKKVYFYRIGEGGRPVRVDMSDNWRGTQCLVYFLGCAQPVVKKDPETEAVRVVKMVGPYLSFKDTDFDKEFVKALEAKGLTIAQFMQDLAKNPESYAGDQMPEVVDGFFGADARSNALHYDVRGDGGGRDTAQGSSYQHPYHAPIGEHDPDPRVGTTGRLTKGNANFDLWSHGKMGHGGESEDDRSDIQKGRKTVESDDITNWTGS